MKLDRKEYNRLKAIINSKGSCIQALTRLKESIFVSDYDLEVKSACIEDIDMKLFRTDAISDALCVDSVVEAGEIG